MALFNTTDGSIGVNLNATSTTQLFSLGLEVRGNNNTLWVYCKAQTAISQYDFVTMDTSYNANSMMAANVKAGQQIGSAQIAFAALDYGWICISGSGLFMGVMTSTQTSVPCIPSHVTGKIDTTAGVAAGVTCILGIELLTTAGAQATSIPGALTSPVLKL